MQTSDPKRSVYFHLCRQTLRKAMAAVLPRRLFVVSELSGNRSVCLTFDDGPHPENTPRLLDHLKELGVRATFFVIGQRAERYPEIVRRMATEGHVVANHSFSHGKPGGVSSRELVEDVNRTQRLLETLVGKPPLLFRPPNGKVTMAKLWRLWRAGWTVVLWDLDSKDYSCESADELRNWFAGRTFHGGNVILMHDACPHTGEVIPELVARIRACGLTFATPRSK